jgi:hypothetical protein
MLSAKDTKILQSYDNMNKPQLYAVIETNIRALVLDDTFQSFVLV